MVVSKSGVVKFLSVIAIILIVINSIILVIYFIVDDPDKFDFVQMFDLDMERNVPTLFSSAILLIAAYLFYLLSVVSVERNDCHHKAWLGLSWVFIFLAFDESAKIHEQIGDFTENFVDASGFLYYPWVISYGLLTIVLAIIYLPFFLKMERKRFWQFMLAAFIYLGGAVGLELLGAREADLHDTDTILYCSLYTVEESMEMFGVIYLINILLDLLRGEKLLIEE